MRACSGNRSLVDVESDPGKVFEIIKAKLLRFSESTTEKQMPVLSEWENLAKGKMSVLAFEPMWERVLAELETVGLARGETELTLTYLSRIGPSLAADVQRDMRPWPGGLVSRRAATWEECHVVCLELESLKQGGRALNSFPNAGSPDKKSHEGDGERPAGPAGREASGKGAGGKGVCFEFRDKGTCRHGDSCRNSRDVAEPAKNKKG